MKLSLAENIRAFRKERRLTQEQVAEALGVTVGSVYMKRCQAAASSTEISS